MLRCNIPVFTVPPAQKGGDILEDKTSSVLESLPGI